LASRVPASTLMVVAVTVALGVTVPEEFTVSTA
jgi:hypothetical protein